MGVREWMITQLGGVSTKSLATFQSIGVQGLGTKLEQDIVSLIAAYRNNPVVYACVRAKAEAITDPTVQVQKRGGDNQWAEDVGHPLKRLLMEPNPGLSAEQFMRAWVVSREVTGVFYCEVIRSAAGLPVELYPLDPSYVFPVFETDRDGRLHLLSYEWVDGAYRKPIPLSNMLAMSDWNLGGTLSPLAVAIYSVNSDTSHTDHIRAFWQNAGIPAGLLTIKREGSRPAMTDEDIEETQDRWAAQYSNRYGRAHRIVVLDEMASYQRTGMNLNELTSKDIREVDEARICMSLGVPPLIVYAYTGMQRATYSNLDEAWEQFWKTTMSAQLKDLRAWLTMSLLREFETADAIKGEQVRVGWDLSEVGSLQEDVNEAEARQIAKWKAGLLTMDESRSSLGMPQHPDPAYGVLNVYELMSLANALAGTAAVAALDGGLTKSMHPGALDTRIGDLEWSIASLQGRITNLATGGDDTAVLLGAGSNGEGDDQG